MMICCMTIYISFTYIQFILKINNYNLHKNPIYATLEFLILLQISKIKL